MSCFHPLLAYATGWTDNGKMKYCPVGTYDSFRSNVHHSKDVVRQRYKKGDIFIDTERRDGCYSVIDGKVYPAIEIPCGKCIGCRLDKSREWALRCMLELKDNKGIACFVTLTYNESRVPLSYFPDPDTGEALPVYSLRLDDIQRFWKRLRKSLPDVKIRYFASGEYGSETWRPHYHAIIFGYRPDDLVVVQENAGQSYYKSDFLDSVWSCGSVIVGDCNANTCAYVARYTSKKSVALPPDFYKVHNIEEPFLVMSRRPGIGWKAFEAVKSDMYTDKIYVSGADPVEGRVPRSYLQKLEELDPDLYKIIKETREKKGSVYERALAFSMKVPYSKLLEDEEANLLAKTRALSRKKV